MRAFTCLFVVAGLFTSTLSQGQEPSGAQLVATMKAAKPGKGGLQIRVRMEVHEGGAKSTRLLQIKRRTLPDGRNEQLYQVNFPKERKGEALLLRTSPQGFTGLLVTPGNAPRKLTNADRKLNLFGSDMTLEDALADFLDWPKHEIVGHESLHGIACAIVESKPGSGERKVRTWVEEKRYVAQKIQVFDSGGDKPTREIETNKVMRGESGYYFPASFTIRTLAKGTDTLVEGTGASEQEFTDADFADAVLQAPAKGP